MSEPAPKDAPTKESIGRRIKQALKDSGRAPEWLASEAQISLSNLYRFMRGSHEPSAIEMWRIASATGKKFSWFAGIEDGAPTERFALAADEMQKHILGLRDQLKLFERDLRDARRLAAQNRPVPIDTDEAQLDETTDAAVDAAGGADRSGREAV